MKPHLAGYEKELEELLHSDWQTALKNETPNEGVQNSVEKNENETGGWSSELGPLIHWFLSIESLPEGPFQFCPASKIFDSQKFYESLRDDIAIGPKGVRSRFGGLQSDLVNLKKIVKLKEKEK